MSKIEYGALSEDGSVLKTTDGLCFYKAFGKSVWDSERRRVWHKWVNDHLVETVFLGRGTTFPPDWEIDGVRWFQTWITSKEADGSIVGTDWVCQYSDNIQGAATQYQSAVKFAEALPPITETVSR